MGLRPVLSRLHGNKKARFRALNYSIHNLATVKPIFTKADVRLVKFAKLLTVSFAFCM